MGFDAACIALSRATFEQMARDVLIKTRTMTEPEIRKTRPTADTLLNRLKQAGLLVVHVDAAKRLTERGNQVLHRGIYEERLFPQMSLDAIGDLGAVAGELCAHW
jgi:Mn-dependent DtxR family transcriptional regulator